MAPLPGQMHPETTPQAPRLAGPAVLFEHVALTLGGASILQDVNLRIEPGALQAIVGPNGGGKSSLLRCLMGQAAHRGQISLDWPGAPGRIGFVPQVVEFDRALPMTVRDFLAVLTTNRPAFLRARGALSARIDTMLDRVGLNGKADRRMGALSGGERQRVLLAQALIDDQGREPDLLVLDEPMAALDAAGAAIFERIITDLHQRGATVIWVEHDIAAVRRMASRVTAIDGSILFQGTPQDELTPERILSLFSHRRGQPAPDRATEGASA